MVLVVKLLLLDVLNRINILVVLHLFQISSPKHVMHLTLPLQSMLDKEHDVTLQLTHKFNVDKISNVI